MDTCHRCIIRKDNLMLIFKMENITKLEGMRQ